MRTILTTLLSMLCLAGQGQSAITDSLLRKLQSAADDTGKVNLFKQLGNAVAHQNPRQAIVYWKQGIVLARKIGFVSGLGRTFSNMSIGFSYDGQIDSALAYNDSALRYVKQINDARFFALVYLNRSDNLYNLHRYAESHSYADTALKYARISKDNDRLARIYHIMANVYEVQQQFPDAKKYYLKALQAYERDHNKMMIAQVYNDFGELYHATKQLDSALKYNAMAIQLADSLKDYNNLSAYYLTNGVLFSEQHKLDEAEINYRKSEQFAKQQENELQLLTLYGNWSGLELQKKHYSKAIEYGLRSYNLLNEESALGFRQQTTATLAEAYAGAGDYRQAYHYSQLANELGQTYLKKTFDENTAVLQKQFEVREKDVQIDLLNKERELQRQQLHTQKLRLIGGFVIGALLLAALLMLFVRFRLQQKMKAMKLRNNIAADLHDEVGSSLSSIHLLCQMAAMSASKTDGELALLQRVSANARETMEKMSDIVWMIKPAEHEGTNLGDRIERSMYELCSPRGIRSSLTGADLLDQVLLDMEQRKELYLLIKEAVNNGVKYSEASNITVSVSRRERDIAVDISDNGKGFDPVTANAGNGLSNMKQRAKKLHGALQINSRPGQGTTIGLLIPRQRFSSIL